MTLVYGSVCSGIEAASVAWRPLGWRAAFFSEIEPFPSAVLAHHYPAVPNCGDMTRFREWPDATLDVLVGGTPCQSFSVAGLRKGLDDPRGNLALVYLALADRYRPRWLVWENVPGVLSSNGGRDFGAFLGGLAQLGYGFAYRVLDARYFGVPQRRRRVFVVGHLGDWRRAAAVLFERASLSGHPAPSQAAREGTPVGVEIGPGGGRFTELNPTLDARAKDGPVRNQLAGAVMVPDVARCDTAREGARRDWGTETMIAHALRAEGFDASEDGTGRGTPIIPIQEVGKRTGKSTTDPRAGMGIGRDGDPMFTLQSCAQHAVAFNWQSGGDVRRNTSASGTDALTASQTPAAMLGMAVRRLTPRECERLQGFPDDYSLIPYRGKLAADGPRYKALGNSMAVPVMRWIGERITLAESAAQEAAA